jgi:hypothetical protein
VTISTSANSASISTNEYFLFGNSTVASYQTTDAYLYGIIDFANMIAGDQYRIRVYEKANGSSALAVVDAYVSGVQSGPYEIAVRLMTEGYEVSVLRTAGTDRTIGWSLRTDTGPDTTAAIAAAVMAYAHESGRTLLGVFRRLDALLTGKATGLLSSLATFYRADGVTKAIEATQNTTAGTRETASTVGGD